MRCPVCGGECGGFICKGNVLARNDITVCCCANPVCLEKGCQIQANQTFPSAAVKYVPVTMPDPAAAERAVIVEWLRSVSCVDWEPASLQIADCIEAGEHHWRSK